MKILYQLDRPNFRASKSDKILLRYIKENASVFCTTPIAVLAKNCGVSEATITRFVRKMGFSSLQFFKLILNEELADSKKHFIMNSDISSNEPIGSTAKKLLAHNISALERTVMNLDEQAIIDTAKLFPVAGQILFAGIGSSGFAAMDTAYKFMRIGMNAKGLENAHMIMLQVALLEKDDVLVAISHMGNSSELTHALSLAKQKGVKVILVTSNRNAILADYADICIFYKQLDPILDVETVCTKTTQLFVLDLIYTQVIKENMESAVEFRQKTTKAMDILKLKE